MPDLRHRRFFGMFLLGAILFVALFGVLFRDKSGSIGYSAEAASATSTFTSGNAAPIVSGFAVNGGTNVTLIPNGTTTVTVNYVVTDDNGCGSVFYTGNVTTTFYRSGASSSCAISSPSFNYLNCYVVSTTTHNCPSANSTTTSANVTTTIQVWYFADSTSDTSTASSTYPSQNWLAYASARDASSTTGASSSATGIEVNVLLAIQPTTSSLNYGTVNPNTNTGATNQNVTIKNAGNASTTLQTYGTAMCNGGTCIATSSQHYATSTFTYGGGEQALAGVAAAISGWRAQAVPLGQWATTTPYPATIGYHSSFVANGFVYVVGGWTGAIYTSTVQYAPINATGSIGAWATTTPYPATIGTHTSFVANGFVYVVGGFASSTADTSTVRYAPLNATGSIGAWATTTPYPATIGYHPSFVANGFVYVVGGIANGAFTSTVRYAPLNATGSIGAWATTTPYPATIARHPSFISNGFVYVVGGFNGAYTSTVRYAPLNATGSIGAWATTTPYPATIRLHTSFVANGFVYVVGGDSGIADTSTVSYAPLSSDGNIGQWATTTPYPATISYHPSFVANGFVYVVGGYVSSTWSSTVSYAPLPTKDTYWGLGVPNGTASGTYSGVNTFIAVYSP